MKILIKSAPNFWFTLQPLHIIMNYQAPTPFFTLIIPVLIVILLSTTVASAHVWSSKKKKVGSLRCAFRVSTIDGESAGESARIAARRNASEDNKK